MRRFSGIDVVVRNRVLRTYVRNVYRYHRNEIFAAIRNEYTDWERPIQHPINIRDATLEALADGAGAAPALRLAQLHARRGATTYFAHFAHQTRDAEYPQVYLTLSHTYFHIPFCSRFPYTKFNRFLIYRKH